VLTKAAKDAGADAALLVTPYYNKPTQEGLYLHHKAIAEAVDIDQILYNVPGRTACDMLPETVVRLSQLPNIIGIKEATGDLSRMEVLVNQTPADFALYTGDDATAMDFILAGGHGDISVTANVAPKEMAQLCSLALMGDKAGAEVVNKPLLLLHDRLFVESNPIPVKWALGEMGMIDYGIRLPLTVLDSKYHSAVREALQQAKISLK
jgi:4-hydroxy-tetrahydrodipicolinate synthase